MKNRDNKEDFEVDGGIILNWMLEKKDWRMWTGFIWLRIDINVGCCDHGNEPSGYVKYWEYRMRLRNYRILKDDLSEDDFSSSNCTWRRKTGYVNN
jgi:hypothetical protein